MKLSPINNCNSVSTKGYVNNKIPALANKIIYNFGMDEKGVLLNGTLSLENCEKILRLQTVKENLFIMMQKFAFMCELTFEKVEEKYRFSMENPYSDYKVKCGDIEFSKELNQTEDVDKFEGLVERLSRLIPSKVNNNFYLHRTKNIPKDYFSGY